MREFLHPPRSLLIPDPGIFQWNPHETQLPMSWRHVCICSRDSASMLSVRPGLSCLSRPFSLRLSLSCLQAHCAALINTFTMCCDILKLHMSRQFLHVLNTHRACLTAAVLINEMLQWISQHIWFRIICLCLFNRNKYISFLCLFCGNKDTFHDSPHLAANPV